MAGLVWLASDPKSGSTWVRIFLHHYLDIGPLTLTRFQPDQNGLFGDPVANSHHVFEEVIGLSASEIGPGAVARLRFALHADLAAGFERDAAARPSLVKTHDAFHDLAGAPQFRLKESGGAIVLVRNPLDVAVSYANFLAEDLDTIIGRMARHDMRQAPGLRMPQAFGSWSLNVQSWSQQTDLPCLTLRYEDILDAPELGFARILQFLSIAPDPGRVSSCVKQTRFGALRAAEEQQLSARPPGAQSQRFFRKGEQGNWRSVLSERQVRQIVNDHADVMDVFDYLSSAEDWLSARAQPTT